MLTMPFAGDMSAHILDWDAAPAESHAISAKVGEAARLS
jgi:hypothetical protein